MTNEETKTARAMGRPPFAAALGALLDAAQPKQPGAGKPQAATEVRGPVVPVLDPARKRRLGDKSQPPRRTAKGAGLHRRAAVAPTDDKRTNNARRRHAIRPAARMGTAELASRLQRLALRRDDRDHRPDNRGRNEHAALWQKLEQTLDRLVRALEENQLVWLGDQ